MTTAFPASPLRRLGRALAILFLSMPLAQAANVGDLVDRKWIEIGSPNFRVVTDQPEDVARHMIVDLENLRYISNRVRGAQSLDGPPLTIVAMGRSSYATLGLPRGMDGVFQLSRHGYAAVVRIEDYVTSAAASDVSRATILHEYHHFLLHYSPETTAYPRWYDEGMSEYWSSLVIQDGMAWFGHPVDGSHREDWLVDQTGRVSFDTEWLFNTTRLTYDDSTRTRGKWLYGEYQWPAVDKLAFTGGIDGEGRRDGPGWCRTAGAPQIDLCVFREDRRVTSDTKHD